MRYISFVILVIALTMAVSCTKNGTDISFILTEEEPSVSYAAETQKQAFQGSNNARFVETAAESDEILHRSSISEASEKETSQALAKENDVADILNTSEKPSDRILIQELNQEIISYVVFGSSIYTYDEELGGYSVASSGLDNQLVILPYINGIPVVSIKENAFSGMPFLNGSLEIPSTIRDIGARAFYGCSGLTGDLFIPDNVEEIGVSAFENCFGLDGIIYLGKGLTEIKNRVFYNCKSIHGDILIPKNITSIASDAFYKCVSPGCLVLYEIIETNPEQDVF